MKRSKQKHIIPKMTTLLMEVVLMEHFAFKSNHIVPGILINGCTREVDLLVVTNSGYAYEVEIKVSKADLLADKKKKHTHNYGKMKSIWFAVSENIPVNFALENIPEHAGLIWVYYNWDGKYKCRIVRMPVNKPKAHKWSKEEVHDLLRLGTMRIYSLKRRALMLTNKLERN